MKDGVKKLKKLHFSSSKADFLIALKVNYL